MIKGNAARANQWMQSGEYVHLQSGCPECGGWYLNRKDEMAGITGHFTGCSRIELSLLDKMMRWSAIMEYADRLKFGKIV